MKRILVGIDGSKESRAAASFAANLAAETGAQLTLAAIAFQPDPLGEPELQARTQRDKEEIAKLVEMTKGLATELARPNLSIDTLVEPGTPAAALSELASSMDVDLVVVGRTGRNAIKHLLLGSVADRLVHICRKPVTVVH